MIKLRRIFVFIIVLTTGIVSLHSSTIALQKRQQGKSSLLHKKTKRGVPAAMAKRGAWDLYNSSFLVEGSYEVMEDLLDVLINPYLKVFPWYDHSTSLFDGTSWKQWDQWSSFLVSGETYECSTAFDGKGNITEYHLTEESIYSMTYNSSSLPTEWKTYSWDEVQSQWIEPLSYTFTYSGQNRLNSFEVSYQEEVGGAWKKLEKYDFSYDVQKNLVGEQYFYWDTTANAWQQDYRWAYYYNGDGAIAKDTGFYWEQNWIEDSRSSYSYKDTKLIEYVEYYKKEGSSAWTPVDYKHLFAYNSKGELTEEYSDVWDTMTQVWKRDGTKYIYSYSADGDITESKGLIWDNGSFSKGVERFTFSYIGTKSLKEQIAYSWSSASSSWQDSVKSLFVYDSLGKPKSCILYEFEPTQRGWKVLDTLFITFKKQVSISAALHTQRRQELFCCKTAQGIRFTYTGKLHPEDRLLLYSLQGRLIAELTQNTLGTSDFYWYTASRISFSMGSMPLVYTLQQKEAKHSGVILLLNQ